jgi:DNA-binding NtrC family response regulator
VVDDDQDLRATIAEFLNMNGFEPLEAANGLEALIQVRRARPAVVVLDIVMPRLGGLQALRRIRAFDPRILAIVVSGVTDESLLRQAAAEGATAVLVKPVSLPDIVAVIRGQTLPPPEDVASLPPTPPEPAGRILVVDDEPGVRATIGEFLATRGYVVRSVADGAAAMRAVAEEAPDVVLLDIQMPGVDGIEALAVIRRVAPLVKVIMVSGITDVEVARRALAFGAFDFVGKPVDLDYLDRTIRIAISMTTLEQG